MKIVYLTVRHIHERKKLVTLCFIRVLPTDWAVWLDCQMMHCTVHAAIDQAVWAMQRPLKFVCVMFSVGQSVPFVPVVTSNEKRYRDGLKWYNRMSRIQDAEIQTRLIITL